MKRVNFQAIQRKEQFPGAMALLQLLQLHVPLQLLAVPQETRKNAMKFQGFYPMDMAFCWMRVLGKFSGSTPKCGFGVELVLYELLSGLVIR